MRPATLRRIRSFTRTGPARDAPDATTPQPRLPPATAADLRAPALELFKRRVAQVMFDTYLGIPLLKFPEDLRVYEHILFAARVEVVLEIGTQHGGSALWFRDRLRTLAAYGYVKHPRIISIDLDISEARQRLTQADPAYASEITLIEGDVRDASTTDRVSRLIGSGSSCLVVEDAAHTYETTMAALRAFARLVQPGGFFVVEDGCVDIEEMRLHPDWPRGVLPAVREWLSTPEGRGFRQRRDMELYGISCHPGGFLQRIAEPAEQ